MGICVGIDLGTTFSVVSHIDSNTLKPQVIKNSFNKSITPSVLFFDQNGEILFGEDAKNIQLTGEENVASFFKRSMGKDNFQLDFNGKSYTATDLSAILLKKLVEEAEANIGEKIDSAVITIPAYFSHKERIATLEAGKKAGLNVLELINEPTAAALAYGLNNENQRIMIYDLGGGTFDVTIAEINEENIKILGCDGNHELGGKDWDDCIARYLASEFLTQYNEDLTEDSNMCNSLLVIAEDTKKKLTSMDTVKVNINYKDIKGTIEITNEIFESISEFLLGSTRELTENLLKQINLNWKQIDGVILVGGSTRMKMIHKYVENMSGNKVLGGVNVDEAVSLGAAVQANTIISKKKMMLSGSKKTMKIKGSKDVTDVIAHSLGMISIDVTGKKYINSIIIPKNSTIPAEYTKTYQFKTSNKKEENVLEAYVMQGEFERPLDNTILDKYVITGMKHKSEKINIDVIYKYNINGIVEVMAREQDTKKELTIKIEKIIGDMSWTDEPPVVVKNSNPVKLIIAIDTSGSMSGTPIRKVKDSINEFLDMNENIEFEIITFDDSVKLISRFEDPINKKKDRISRIDAGFTGNADEPFSYCYDRFSSFKKEQKCILILTDGDWDATPKKRSITLANKCKNEDVTIIAIGFGYANYEFLKKISTSDDMASLIDLDRLNDSFSKIAQDLG